MNLHENQERFTNAVIAASQLYGIPEIYIEKDYWVTLALYSIFHSDLGRQAVFKGGTALSKCYNLIERFSEDIDIVILQEKDGSKNQLTKKMRNISQIVAQLIPEIQIEGLTNKKGNIRKTVHGYPKHYDGDLGQVREHIVLEVTWLGSFEPFTKEVVSCYIAEMMKSNNQERLVKEHNMESFTVQVLRKERTFCEKVMSLVRFSFQGNPYVDLANKIRHVYDIHLMLKDTEVNIFFTSKEFDEMIIAVGMDDVISFKNNNGWLANHPGTAIIFDHPDETWNRIKTPYQTTFKDLVTGKLPEESALIETLKKVSEKLKQIEWNEVNIKLNDLKSQ